MPPRASRLATRLTLSHALPVLLVAGALAAVLVALVRVTMILAALKEDELGALRDEGGVHSAVWALDVALRHANDACQRGEPRPEALVSLPQSIQGLREHVESTRAGNRMLPLAGEYLALVAPLEAAPTCELLRRHDIHRRREALDESVTTLWVTRLQVLHDAASSREEEARRIGTAASWAGLSLTLLSVVVAFLVARRMAGSLATSLEHLAATARRVGNEDFETPVMATGPLELLNLAAELERMRRRLARLDSTKQGFLASVSHELRTPLSKIREALALLGDGVVGELGPRQLRVLQIAREACEREIRMVTTLLDLSRLRSGTPVRSREGVSLDGVIELALRDEREEAEARGVAISLELAGAAPPADLDPVLVERAVANLVRNAVAVSRRGQRVSVRRAVQGSGEGARLVVSVTDEGPGVPDAIRDILFDPFVTSEVPRSGKALGIGLGLALAREVARAHGGDLVLEPGGPPGATFRLWLPASRDGGEREAAPRMLPSVEEP